jgi:hypothetical protein
VLATRIVRRPESRARARVTTYRAQTFVIEVDSPSRPLAARPIPRFGHNASATRQRASNPQKTKAAATALAIIARAARGQPAARLGATPELESIPLTAVTPSSSLVSVGAAAIVNTPHSTSDPVSVCVQRTSVGPV